LDRPDSQQVRIAYANDPAASAAPGQPYPYGSVFVMESYGAGQDAQGRPALDEQGRYQPDELLANFVMRKEPGCGADYGSQRSGEWEYLSFRPDGSYLTASQATNPCAACHQDAGATRDWVWGSELFFQGRSGAVPSVPEGLSALGRVTIDTYSFLPGTLDAQVGQAITFVDGVDPGRLNPGSSYRRTFSEPGRYEYFCAIHPAMRASITVQA
jgi:plastocyanin